jgi:hypothetical protein
MPNLPDSNEPPQTSVAYTFFRFLLISSISATAVVLLRWPSGDTKYIYFAMFPIVLTIFALIGFIFVSSMQDKGRR